jgi:hypothetical protein
MPGNCRGQLRPPERGAGPIKPTRGRHRDVPAIPLSDPRRHDARPAKLGISDLTGSITPGGKRRAWRRPSRPAAISRMPALGGTRAPELPGRRRNPPDQRAQSGSARMALAAGPLNLVATALADRPRAHWSAVLQAGVAPRACRRRCRLPGRGAAARVSDSAGRPGGGAELPVIGGDRVSSGGISSSYRPAMAAPQGNRPPQRRPRCTWAVLPAAPAGRGQDRKRGRARS